MGYLDDAYNRWAQLKQNVEDDQAQKQQQAEASITPADQTAPADTFRNQMISGLGLPQQWQTTVADQKRQAAKPQVVEAGMPAYAIPQEGAAEAATQGAETLAPNLKQWAQQMMQNPSAPIEVSGPINMNSFQKLRDVLGHVGPIVVKGGQ